jgi:hypothetical protein
VSASDWHGSAALIAGVAVSAAALRTRIDVEREKAKSCRTIEAFGGAKTARALPKQATVLERDAPRSSGTTANSTISIVPQTVSLINGFERAAIVLQTTLRGHAALHKSRRFLPKITF